MSLIYINRLQVQTDIPILPTTWRPLVFISLLISQKLTDDKPITNAYFMSIYPFFELKELNLIELKYLELIEYKTHVTLKQYMKYYLELKALIPEKHLLQPINVKTMKKIIDFTEKKEKVLKSWSKSSSKEFTEGEYSISVLN